MILLLPSRGWGGVALSLVSERTRLAVCNGLLVHLHLHLLLVHHMRRHRAESIVETHWHWSHVLVRVESTKATRKSSQVSNRGDLNHRVGVVVRGILVSTVVIPVVTLVIVVVSPSVVLQLLRHWRESHSFWEVWKRIDELSLLLLVVVEGAAITELAFSVIEEVLARHGLVVGVNGAESGLSEVLWEWLL